MAGAACELSFRRQSAVRSAARTLRRQCREMPVSFSTNALPVTLSLDRSRGTAAFFAVMGLLLVRTAGREQLNVTQADFRERTSLKSQTGMNKVNTNEIPDE